MLIEMKMMCMLCSVFISHRLRKMWQKRKCSVQNCYLTIAHGTVSADITLSKFSRLQVLSNGLVLDSGYALIWAISEIWMRRFQSKLEL